MAVIALAAGHNRGTGARSHDGVDEWCWNTEVLHHLKRILRGWGHSVHELTRDAKLGYTAAMRRHGREMRALCADVALELHFNAGPAGARGAEFLHWWGSGKGRRLARLLGAEHRVKFPGIRLRGRDGGARSLWYHRWNEGRAYSGRGGAFVFLTPCPAVICEPGFASDAGDWRELRERALRVAEGYANALQRFVDDEGL